MAGPDTELGNQHGVGQGGGVNCADWQNERPEVVISFRESASQMRPGGCRGARDRRRGVGAGSA